MRAILTTSWLSPLRAYKGVQKTRDSFLKAAEGPASIALADFYAGVRTTTHNCCR